MEERTDNRGIGVIKYARLHEAYIRRSLRGDCDRAELARYHNMKIQWLQHERLIHLLVTILFAFIFMFLFAILMLYTENWVILIPLTIVTVLLGAYIFHYFELENTVQSWYKLYDEIDSKQ
ncbi:MAG TPA: hypothetical protein DCR71_00885 [Dehalococcoidia bacterium]|jgi:hypothetical protein|nr:hypothetical protein [Dehalococcoidia bacterium]HAS27820.1 hypothetical protein [Dehalococcoidia bacterium]